MSIEKAKRKGAKDAKAAKPIPGVVAFKFSGAFSRWKKGERILARYIGGGFFSISRAKWKGELPVQNQCFMVPKAFLEFPSLRASASSRLRVKSAIANRKS